MVQMMGAMYDYMKDYCVCSGTEVYLGMRDLGGQEVGSFPVTVYNVNEVSLSVANNKEQYISIWNSDADNRLIGLLTGLIGPFSFNLRLKPGQSAPPYVIGDSGAVGAVVYNQAYNNVYA